MGEIMTGQNLAAYMAWRGKPWQVDDLLYERLPMLAIRSYLTDDKDHQWPLCWKKGRSFRLGLVFCIDALKSFQAFRSKPGEATRRELAKSVPRVVMALQTWLRRQEIYRVNDVSQRGRDAVISKMARAVAEVSACKHTATCNPMLGSKVLHFFFPEFFPVWDTAWIKRTLDGLSKKKGEAVEEA
jgi:hypothetical protein